MTRPWPRDEARWAKECFGAGDTIEEIADVAGRDPDDVRRLLGARVNISPQQREILSLYAAGLTLAEIDLARGAAVKQPGKAASVALTRLRKRGLVIPHHHPACVR